jgi:hypothetical protein
MTSAETRILDGRDELNLADFPISALPRTQKSTEDGKLVDRMELTSTRYDPIGRRRIQQKVTLTSTAYDGLPTPADEHVILALLAVAKHSHNFSSDTVSFSPTQLFEIMGWAPNGRSYARLKDVLRRLKALNIRYENSWWDKEGRAYEQEIATGIISGYVIAQQTSGPRKKDQVMESSVTWTQAFQKSLQMGNLKKLNLEVFFNLSTPTAQRMYRFLDKRFYNSATVTLDLVDFACGHIGLTEVDNVALLKRRLTPAIEELEAIGFLEPMPLNERFQKVKVGEWKVTFSPKQEAKTQSSDSAPQQTEIVDAPEVNSSALDVVRLFYKLWENKEVRSPSSRDMEHAGAILMGRSKEQAERIVTELVRVTRNEWPECRSLSGAVQKYLPLTLEILEQAEQREAKKREVEEQRSKAKSEIGEQKSREQKLQAAWEALSSEAREAIEQRVRRRLSPNAPTAFVRRFCLEELAKELGNEVA